MANNNLPTKILVIDQDVTVGQRLAGPLSRHGVNCTTAKDIESAIYIFNQEAVEVVLVSTNLEEMPGLVLMQKMLWPFKARDIRMAGVLPIIWPELLISLSPLNRR